MSLAKKSSGARSPSFKKTTLRKGELLHKDLEAGQAEEDGENPDQEDRLKVEEILLSPPKP